MAHLSLLALPRQLGRIVQQVAVKPTASQSWLQPCRTKYPVGSATQCLLHYHLPLRHAQLQANLLQPEAHALTLPLCERSQVQAIQVQPQGHSASQPMGPTVTAPQTASIRCGHETTTQHQLAKRIKLSAGTLNLQQQAAVPAQQQQSATMLRPVHMLASSEAAAEVAVSAPSRQQSPLATAGCSLLWPLPAASPLLALPADLSAAAHAPTVKLEAQTSSIAAGSEIASQCSGLPHPHGLSEHLLQQFQASANLDAAAKHAAIADLIAAVADDR